MVLSLRALTKGGAMEVGGCEEYYLSIVSERLGCTVSFSARGGIEIDETAFVPSAAATLTSEICASLIASLPLKVRRSIEEFIIDVHAFFINFTFAFLKMNPFTLVEGKQYPLIMRREGDDTATFKNFQKWGNIEFPLSFGRDMRASDSIIHGLDEETGITEHDAQTEGIKIHRGSSLPNASQESERFADENSSPDIQKVFADDAMVDGSVQDLQMPQMFQLPPSSGDMAVPEESITFCSTDYAECEAVVTDYPPFREAMKKRGIEDMDLVMENGYARPVKGLYVLVDIQNVVIVEFEDRKLVPLPPADPLRNYTPGETRGIDHSDIKYLHILQPEGPSFHVNGHFVPYGDTDEPHYRKNAFDAGEDGLGKNAHALKKGCDCLSYIKYFDAHFTNYTGGVDTIENCVCLHEEDHGILWKHQAWRTGLTEDGKIEAEVKLTGILSLGALQHGESRKLHGDNAAPSSCPEINKTFPMTVWRAHYSQTMLEWHLQQGIGISIFKFPAPCGQGASVRGWYCYGYRSNRHHNQPSP